MSIEEAALPPLDDSKNEFIVFRDLDWTGVGDVQAADTTLISPEAQPHPRCNILAVAGPPAEVRPDSRACALVRIHSGLSR
jgi:hypothetical protein